MYTRRRPLLSPVPRTAMASRTLNGQYRTSPVPRTGNDERTGKQPAESASRMDYWVAALSATYGQYSAANGGSYLNPLGFPGYGMPYLGSYQTYRWMLQHPVLRLVRSICVGIILASVWEFEKEDNEDPTIKDEWLDHVSKVYTKLRWHLITDFFIPGRDMGWQGGEPIWEYEDGKYILKRVKPLNQDHTEILEDKYGNFVGFRNNVQIDNKASVDLPAPYKAWKFTYDEPGNGHHGRSWLENCRATAWKDWLDAASQIQKIGSKISGTFTIIKSPAGTFPGPIDQTTGKPKQISYKENAERTIKGLAEGAAGAWFPSLALAVDAKGNLDAMKVLAELAGKSLTSIDVVDHSGNAAAIGPMLERLKHDEELMFNAGLRSARVGLEATHGTKEEAGVHTDTGTVNAETEDEGFARAVQHLIDADLELNFTPRAKGKIRIKPPSLVDRKTAVVRAVILAMMNHPAVALAISKCVDVNQAFRVLDIALSSKFDAKAIDDAVKATQPPAATATTGAGRGTPSPEGGRPTDNPRNPTRRKAQ